MFEQPCQRGYLKVLIKVEEQFNTNNARSMWQGINNITDFKGNKPATVNIAASLPDELNLFYFEAHNTAHTESAPAAVAEEVSSISISVVDVTFKRVNILILQTGEYPQGCGS